MEILRTPDDRFVDLPGFDFEPHYVEVQAIPGSADPSSSDGDRQTLRVHYIERAGPTPTRRSSSCMVSRRGATCTGRWFPFS
jgi:hypothetical protein